MDHDDVLYEYRETGPQRWTVGFYTPTGKWKAESDHDHPAEAVDRMIDLNGDACPPRRCDTSRKTPA